MVEIFSDERRCTHAEKQNSRGVVADEARRETPRATSITTDIPEAAIYVEDNVLRCDETMELDIERVSVGAIGLKKSKGRRAEILFCHYCSAYRSNPVHISA